MDFIKTLITNSLIKILIIVIVFDTIFGILRAIKERKINSTIGIDGIIRKVGMIICILFLFLIDMIVNINLIGFIPEIIRDSIGVKFINISDLFNILFIVFEMLSIFKNAILCKLPIPKKLQEFLEKVLIEFTGEIKENNLVKGDKK